MFKYGIEHEVAFLNSTGKFADFTNINPSDFNNIIDELPEEDALGQGFRVDRFNIMRKGWYVEGYERFNDDGSLKSYQPKGLEIRTAPKNSIGETLQELSSRYKVLKEVALKHGFTPTWISHNPFLSDFEITKPLSKYEEDKLANSPEDRTEHIAMLTYGPDINFSKEGMSDEQLVDVAKKLTALSPFIVPFSFSSPFANGQRFNGYSYRTWRRTGERHAARVFLKDEKNLLPDSALTRVARLEPEVGRIEFKAFDSANDWRLYGGLLALIKGLVLDQSLKERRDIPDTIKHRTSAILGFKEPFIFSRACHIMSAAREALTGDLDQVYLTYLENMLVNKTNPAMELIKSFEKTCSIEETLKQNNYDRLII